MNVSVWWKNSAPSMAMTLVALIVGLGFGGLVALAVGENPAHVIGILVRGSVGSSSALAMTLFNATPIIFTGLSVMWAFRAGLFNVGAEGQMIMGSLAMLSVAYATGAASPWLAWPCVLAAGFVGGGLWGALAGWVKAYRGAHEVLVTILLNFVAFGAIAFSVVTLYRDRASQAPETWAVAPMFHLPALPVGTAHGPANLSLLLALTTSALVALALWGSVFGFRQRLVGGASEVARWNGLNVNRHIVLAMFVAGGLAGWAGLSEVFGYTFRLREGFAAGSGFMGIAVALLGRNSCLGVVLSALLFGALQTGSLALDIETEGVTREMTLVIQAALILTLASEKVFRPFLGRVLRG